MKITAKEEYGLRCMVQMAKHPEKKSLTIPEIARAEMLSPAYVGKLMAILRKGGLVRSIQGPTGGYRLNRPASGLTIGEILAVLGGRIYKEGHCTRYPGQQVTCAHSTACSIRSLWEGIDQVINQILFGTRLSDIADGASSSAAWFRSRFPSTGVDAPRAGNEGKP